MFLNISGFEKLYWMKGGGEYHDFPSKTFCFAVPKISLKNPSVVRFRKLPVAKKFMDKRGEGGLSSKFSVETFFVSQGRKKLAGETFCAVFQKISGSEEVSG